MSNKPKKRQLGNEQRARVVRGANAAIKQSRKNIRRGVTVLRPGDAGFDVVVAQCTPIAQIAEHHGAAAYTFSSKDARRV